MMSQNYICERCGETARIVHHKIYITPKNINNPNITLDWNNLEALCIVCHNLEHKSYGVCNNDVMFVKDGDLIKFPLLKK